MGFKDLFASMRRGRGMALSDSEWAAASKRHPAVARIALDAGLEGVHRDLAAAFLARKQFLGPGLEAPARADAVSAAFNAALPFIGIGPSYWRGWKTVFLLPGVIIDRVSETGSDGVVREYDDELAGEVREFGSVLISIPDLEDSGRGKGYNVVIHEMAHKIDGVDGEMDGRPPLDGKARGAFVEARDAALADFRRRAGRAVRAGGRRARGMSRSRLPMDEYAAEDEAEFFAVSAEAFFDMPGPLARAYPEWYAALASFFRIDPLGFTLPAPIGSIAGGPADPPARKSEQGESV